MTVKQLIQLLETLPPEQNIVVQDLDGDPMLRINGVWQPPPEPEYPGGKVPALQLTTEEV